jgi:hypothetical protein
LYYQNLLTPANFSAFNVAGGAVAMEAVPASQANKVYPYNAGNATFALSGTFTGVRPLNCVVQVTSSTDGTFPNTRYRWSDTDGTTWNVENLTPVSGTPVALSNGISLTFTASSLAPEFVVGDEWDWRELRPNGIVYALDGSRNTEYHSGSLPAGSTLRIGFDLGTAAQPQAFFLQDHNLPSNATTMLFAHASSLFTETGGFSHAVTWRAGRLAEFITSSAFRYWWLRIVMGASSLTSFHMSEMGVFTGFTLDKPPIVGFSVPDQFLSGLDVNGALVNGPGPQMRTAKRPQYTWDLVKQDANSDGGRLDAAFAYATQHASYQQRPFYYVPLDSDLNTVNFYSWAGDLERQHRFLERYDYSVNWIEVIRRVSAS